MRIEKSTGGIPPVDSIKKISSTEERKFLNQPNDSEKDKQNNNYTGSNAEGATAFNGALGEFKTRSILTQQSVEKKLQKFNDLEQLKLQSLIKSDKANEILTQLETEGFYQKSNIGINQTTMHTVLFLYLTGSKSFQETLKFFYDNSNKVEVESGFVTGIQALKLVLQRIKELNI